MSDDKTSGKRARQAAETRRRVRDAAGALFIERGYGATTLRDVADRAGVAVQTVYFIFGNKRTVLKEWVDVTIAGDDAPVATMERGWFREAVEAPTAEEQLCRYVVGAGATLGRVAPILGVLNAAGAADPEVAELWPADDPRYVVQVAAAEALLAKPDARQELTVGYVADVLYGVLSPELYLVFVRERGWSPESWQQWALQTLRHQLCRGQDGPPDPE